MTEALTKGSSVTNVVLDLFRTPSPSLLLWDTQSGTECSRKARHRKERDVPARVVDDSSVFEEGRDGDADQTAWRV